MKTDYFTAAVYFTIGVFAISREKFLSINRSFADHFSTNFCSVLSI